LIAGTEAVERLMLRPFVGCKAIQKSSLRAASY